MGNTFCNCTTEHNPDAPNDIVYTDSTYNIWDNNPVRSQTSLNSQLSFLNNKIGNFQKEQYTTLGSPRNDQSTMTEINNERITQSQLNMKLELLQEIMKKQHSIIHEETEVETVVELPKESYRNIDRHNQPSGFSQMKVILPDEQSYQPPNGQSSQGQQSDYQFTKEDRLCSRVSNSNIQNHFGDSQLTTDQDIIPQHTTPAPSYSMKYIKYDNNYFEEDRLFSMQFKDSQFDSKKE